MQNAVPLRPRTILDLLDVSFSLYRRHFVVFLGTIALIYVPLTILQVLLQLVFNAPLLNNWFDAVQDLALTDPTADPLQRFPFAELLGLYAANLGIGFLQFLALQFVYVGLTNAADRAIAGKPVGILSAYRVPFGRYLSQTLATIIVSLISAVLIGLLLACPLVLLFGVLLSGSGDAGAMLGVTLLLGLLFLGLALISIPIALYLTTRLLLVTQAVVIEQRGPIEALQRSWRLVSGRFWSTLLLVVLSGILSYLIATLPATVLSTVLSLLSSDPTRLSAVNLALTTLFQQLGQMVVMPFLMALFTLLYYDLRIRKEGYDLELQAQQRIDAAGSASQPS